MMTNAYLPHIGGVARSVNTFDEDFRKQGHDVRVVAPTYPDLHKMDPEVERFVIRVPAVQNFNGSDFSVGLPLLGMLNPRLQTFDLDVVHSHHPFLLGDTALRFAADRRVPVIFTHHTLYEEYVHYVPLPSQVMRQFVIELSTHYANLCDAVIAPSESIAALIRKRGVYTPLHVIPTGVDLKAFSGGDGARFRQNIGIGKETCVIGTVGRLAPEKNLYYLSRAVCRFLSETSGTVFLTVGAGPAEKEMQRIFEANGMGNRLIFAGRRTGQELYDAYRAMDIFAFSSLSETQGLVLAEAMAAGLPVVALDASGVREVLRDGRNGFNLPAQASEDDFAAALKKAHDDCQLRAKFREGAGETARDFSRERSADRALRLYDEAIRLKRRERSNEWPVVWSSFLRRLRLEWELLTEKAGSAVEAIRTERGENIEEIHRDRSTKPSHPR